MEMECDRDIKNPRWWGVQGVDEHGKLFREVVEATSAEEAERKLEKEGLWGRKVRNIDDGTREVSE